MGCLRVTGERGIMCVLQRVASGSNHADEQTPQRY